jgi:TIR domain-containing protein
MDVFISWSGERSKHAAEALRAWLPKVINALKPWVSVSDIDKGSRWSADVAGRLEQARFGIICLTPGNLHSDWIVFEAGALSKTLQNTYVCPLLFDLHPADVKGPLAQFQATRAVKEEIRKLLQTVNSALAEQSLTEAHLTEAFDVWWPKLQEQFDQLPAEEKHESPERPEREILEEILALMRSQSRSVATLAQERTPVKSEARSIDEPKLGSPDTSPPKAESVKADDDLVKESGQGI